MKILGERYIQILRLWAVLLVGILGVIGIIAFNWGDGDTSAELQEYESQPIVPGVTTYEVKEGTTAVDMATVLNLSDGTKVYVPATEDVVNISLERDSNTVDLTSEGMQTTGSMRRFSFTEPADLPQFIPTITIPKSEAGSIDPVTINMARIGDLLIDGEVQRDRVVYLPVHRDADGNFVARDLVTPGAAFSPVMPSAAFSDDTGISIAAKRAEPVAKQSIGEKIKGGAKAVYTLATFQESINWGNKPELVRMIPEQSLPARRRPASDQDQQEEDSVTNVIVLVHGHNEYEKGGLKKMNPALAPWGVSYKRDVWTFLYDTFLIDQESLHDCTIFYEFIYPTYRPVFPGYGKTTLGKSLALELNSNPTLQTLVRNNAKFNLFIVAHSMGGLVSRAGLRLMEGELMDHFQKLVTWGTPHHGSPLVSLRYVLGANPGYNLGQGRIFFGTSRLTANELFQRALNALAQLDAPGTRDLRWDGGSATNLLELRLKDYFQVTSDQLAEDIDLLKFGLAKGKGSWPFNHKLRAFNEEPFNPDIKDKYAFLYGITTKRYPHKEEETAIGATVIEALVSEADRAEATYGSHRRGHSDGAVPLLSAAGVDIIPPSQTIYIGDWDHEEYFGSPKDGQFQNAYAATWTARQTFKALDLKNSRYACSQEGYWGKIVLKNFERTNVKTNGEEVTFKARMWWEGPVSYKEREHSYSGSWDEGHPGTSYGGNMTVKIDADTNSVIYFDARKLGTWICGPKLGNVIGHDDYIEGPKQGKAIPFRPWGEYSVQGPEVCTDFITKLTSKLGCPGNEERLKFPPTCDNTSELTLRFWYREPRE